MPSLDAPISGNLFTSGVTPNDADTRITIPMASDSNPKGKVDVLGGSEK